MNLHTPSRLASESQAAYRARRAASHRAVRSITGHGLGKGTTSREQFRDSMRASGTMGKRTRAYVALMAAWASKRVPGHDSFRTGDGTNKRGDGLC